jgi:hypothetical protein
VGQPIDRRKEAAAQAAVTQTWSNCPVEGDVNPLKTIKRQMYRRKTCNAQTTDDRNWHSIQTLELRAQTVRCEAARFALHVFFSFPTRRP